MESPRIIKTHLRYDLLPVQLHAGKGRIIYVTRNPKGSVPSLYRLLNFLKTPVTSSISEFVDVFVRDKVLGSPWWSHVNGYWKRREDPHVLFLKYEDIVKKKSSAIRAIAEFLQQNLSVQDIDKIAEMTSIERMRENTMVNFSFQQKAWSMERTEMEAYINKGDTVGWKHTLSEDLQERIDRVVKDKLICPDLFD